MLEYFQITRPMEKAAWIYERLTDLSVDEVADDLVGLMDTWDAINNTEPWPMTREDAEDLLREYLWRYRTWKTCVYACQDAYWTNPDDPQFGTWRCPHPFHWPEE